MDVAEELLRRGYRIHVLCSMSPNRNLKRFEAYTASGKLRIHELVDAVANAAGPQ